MAMGIHFAARVDAVLPPNRLVVKRNDMSQEVSMLTAEPFTLRDQVYVQTAPGTLAGCYLRTFWQPVYHSIDLPPGVAKPLQIMSQPFTIYRGKSGQVALLDPRCPHRKAQLSIGTIEGDALRCFYHGWKFDLTGACVEQPPEGSAFADKVSVRSYPIREYLGLIFAYLGDGEAPAFPRFPEFERFKGFVEIDSYSRDCNYFQNLENALDMSHVAFVHADNRASFAGIGDGLNLAADESPWGVQYTYHRPDGAHRIQQFGMPNVFYMTALPTDPEIGWQESVFWWVPIDDERHVQFSIHRVPAVGAAAETIHARRQKRRETIDMRHQDVCADILDGKLLYSDVDVNRVDLVRLQDDLAQIGQGTIVDRRDERLGRGDVGVVAIRKAWHRELTAFQKNEPLTNWTRSAELVPKAWILDDEPAKHGVPNGADAPVVDVRPFIEIKEQLKALHARA
jgi:5,5'-dehydrodivanillate O-demethylase oxygenase subunit